LTSQLFTTLLAAIVLAFFIGLLVALRSKLPAFRAAIADLFVALWNPLLDYTFRLIVGAKNLYWLPVGIDHRIFKEKYGRVVNNGGKAEIDKTTNLYPIAPKSGYFLLCATVWAVAFYIWFAVTHSLESIYGQTTDLLLSKLPYLLAAIVALLDIWILRSHALTSKSISPHQSWLITALRLVVSTCIASIAAFHFFSVEYAADIKNAAHDRMYELAKSSADYSRLLATRDALVKAHFDSDAKLECARILSTGSEGKTTVPKFPKEKYLEIAALYRTPPELQSPPTQLNLPAGVTDKECEAVKTNKEPECKLARADRVACPRLTSEAKEGFRRDVALFGTDAAVSRGWFEVSTAFPELLLPRVDAKDSIAGKYQTSQNAIFPADFAKDAIGDLGIASTTIAKKIAEENVIALFLLLSPVVVLAVFEFSIIVIKSIWGITSIDDYLVEVDKQTRNNISGAGIASILAAELKFSSDFSMQDHLGQIFSALRQFVEPLVQSPLIATITVAVLAFISMMFAITELQTLIATFFGSTLTAIQDLFRAKICPGLGLTC
jgi:hypothetical protein